ncbi:DNA polymerase III subunit epsilon [Sphingomonas sp. MAH-20]|uniref:DNA polymerase III subunit epsilon n=1 Tax=Sphingomonas horti TaxID=2682842 RepID=A0A6I4J2F3_9SPHN|nr:3'-5' exonuclease [Sphingomonas horti]MBA2918748.1 DNA polymerase III subunit epsilon [Sphingomonas sp. CGMCC 1.13658]MVO78779.1 DNA polymerase III subunit epsilon [Sphingomonas horti]
MPHANGGCGVAPVREADGCRILHRLEIREGPTGEGDTDAPFVAAIVDVETTGIDHEQDAIIQLGLRRFRFDRSGVVTKIDRPYSWLEDPGRPIPPEITRLTGITDAMVAGHEIDAGAVERMLTNSAIVIAHNSAFDRKWIERRMPAAAGLAWACSMADVDWQARGFDGCKLGFLVMQCGWWFEAHRADADVDAVIALLRHRFDDGRTALQELLETAAEPSWIVRARGAAFEQKNRLRARGYRWDADRKVWWKHVRDGERVAEEFWLAGHVYSAEARPRVLGPDFERVDCWRRYA